MTEYREQRVLFDDNKAQFIVTVEVPTLRDQFAMAALTAIVVEASVEPETAAKYAYEYADAMLKARK